MNRFPRKRPSRRAFLTGSAALLSAPALVQPAFGEGRAAGTRRNTSSFRTLDWRPYFNTLQGGAILVNIDSRALHFWGQDGRSYRLYPSSVPLTEDLTRRGRTRVIRKVEGPDWRPTPSMLRRNPE